MESGVLHFTENYPQSQLSIRNALPMRTPNIQTENRQTKFQAEIKPFFATATSALLLFVVMAARALAVDAVWLTNPGASDWNTNTNCNSPTGNPTTAPVNAGDTATFDVSL